MRPAPAKRLHNGEISLFSQAEAMMRLIRRVHIIGGPGSGKTWLARRLAEAMAAPICNLDDLFWDNNSQHYGTRTSPEVRAERLAEVLSQPCWIVEGVYHQWVQESFRQADLIIVLKPSVFLRDWRIVRRFLRRRTGTERSKKESLRDLFNLVRWNHGYDGDNLRRALETLVPCTEKMIECRSADLALQEVTAINQQPATWD